MSKIELQEWEQRIPEKGNQLYNLFLNESARETAQIISKRGMLDIIELKDGLSISANSYVGKIHLGDIQINVKPKISGMPLYKLLKYAYGLRNLEILSQVKHSLDEFPFCDLLIHQLCAEAEELIARGLSRRYIRIANSIENPRGRIDFGAIVNQGGLITPVLACIYFERMEDSILNRILLAGLRMSIGLTDDLYLRIKLNKLCSQMLNVVSVIELNRDLLLTALQSIDRLTDHYKPVLEIINILFESQGIQWEDSAEQIALHGYMFDMNLFFQSLMSKFLHEYIDRDNYEVLDQYVLWDMFSYNPEYNPKGRRQPILRPDFVIKKNGRIVSLLDAKYRDLWATPLPSEMLYQLAVYAFGGRWKKSKILYPTLHESARVQRIDIREPVTDGLLAQVIIQPVLLIYIVELISQSGKHKEAYDYVNLLAIE